MATVPSCLLLSTSLRLPVRCRVNTQHNGRQQQRWRPAAVAAGARAPSTGVSERKKDGLPHDAIQAFDAKLWAGDLEGCLAVLRRAAAATAADGPPRPLLGPERNRSLIQACFARRRPGVAIAYLQLLPPDVADWAAVLKEASKRRDVDTLRRVLAARSDAGLGPDQRTTTAAIAGYAGSGRLPDALAVFCRAWERPECRTVEVVNAAISACANHGNWEAAQEVLGIMEKEGIAPDVITYNSLLKAAAACGLLGEARRLYAELLQAGLAPSTFTYAALFSAAARARSSDAAWLLQIFDEMQQLGVQPNNHVVSALFAAASFAPCNHAQLERLFAALALLRSFGPPNDTVYSALFTLIQRQGVHERTVDVWGALQADGVRLSPHLFSSLFAACTAELASSALVDVAMKAADAMHAAWRAQVQRQNRRMSEDRDMLVAYNALLHFLGTAGELQRALKVYQSMVVGGPWPDVVSYNTLIAAAASSGNVRVAMRIFSDMVDAEVEPTERTVGALLNCYAKARDAASARKIFDSMSELGIPANVKIYTSLIDACVQARGDDWTQLAFDLLDRMRAEGLAPSAVTYGCLLSACARRGDVERAFQLYKQACDEGVVPSDQMHDMLISMCTQEQRLEEAVDLVKRLARRQPSSGVSAQPATAAAGSATSAAGAAPPPSPRAGGGSGAPGGTATASGLQEHTLNSLIRALCSKYPDRALRLLSLCQTMGMRTSRRTYLSLITGCARASRSAVAYDLYRSLRAQGLDADSPTGSALVVSLCQANQEQVAETVYNDMLALAWRRQRGHLPTPAALRGGLCNTAQLPDTEAMACLVQAFAAAGQLRSAAKFYKQLRRSGPKSFAGVTMSHRRMWELLIESYCRQGSVKQALQVFDDWKAAADAWAAAQQQHLPNLDSQASQAEADGAAAQQAAQGRQQAEAQQAEEVPQQPQAASHEQAAQLAAAAAAVAEEEQSSAPAPGVASNGATSQSSAPSDPSAVSAADEPAPKAAAARAARAARAAAAAKLAGAPGLQAGGAAPHRSHPKLSYVTLAFLEACCRQEAEFEWRVYDVCAVMRQQKETKRQAGLARPQKASHHFAPA